ncbi:hypothetical protein COY87_03205 [Candidatus Roizmanbacteria bacterium CG_4_10_14_0_8_um_filter_33_9]|uniref:Uncharacterized protein n=1 Tax=Candidatus Roizmanbacteria bacterium CG_4_10_14_0_8_um_filter_33_9 TaxID=1974826 RepID=A0A2M7QJ69_9BACT|nr:MAG: hypothetical protein COY87_03205 [Candidatus Roizmanbacteria bacterium CG_4_10_14_0_8_um_filter_33_9]
MIDTNDLKQFMDKVKRIEKGEKLDLSPGEDLSIGIMNLISIEEHLFFSGGKTGDKKYYDLLDEVRKMRVELLKQIIKEYNGEVWCISKHLLAASMRIMEVGTKALKNGEKEKGYDLFEKSYHLYNLFWGLNLGVVNKKELEKNKAFPDKREAPIEYKDEKGNSFLGKMSSMIGKVLDCCRE